MSTLKVDTIQTAAGTGSLTVPAETGTVVTTASPSLGRRNLIINGAMQVAQRGTSATNATGGYTTVDRFFQAGTLGGTFSWEQSSVAPEGFSNSFKVSVPTGFSSLSSSASARVGYAWEGQDLQQLKKGSSNAEKVTLSFYVRAKVTGTYVIELYDEDNARHICNTYTINNADTWEKKTITIDGDISGSFDNDNAKSLNIYWWLGAGSNFTSGTLATTWAAYNIANRAVGQVNSMASNGDDFYITGVQLEVGSVANPLNTAATVKNWRCVSGITNTPVAVERTLPMALMLLALVLGQYLSVLVLRGEALPQDIAQFTYPSQCEHPLP